MPNHLGAPYVSLGSPPPATSTNTSPGVAHDEITEWDPDIAAITDIEYKTHQGTVPPEPPGTETFWVTSAVGTGPQTLDEPSSRGDWKAVIMNADASPGVTAELSLGTAPSSDLQATARTALAIGAAALLGGGLLL